MKVQGVGTTAMVVGGTHAVVALWPSRTDCLVVAIASLERAAWRETRSEVATGGASSSSEAEALIVWKRRSRSSAGSPSGGGERSRAWAT